MLVVTKMRIAFDSNPLLVGYILSPPPLPFLSAQEVKRISAERNTKSRSLRSVKNLITSAMENNEPIQGVAMYSPLVATIVFTVLGTRPSNSRSCVPYSTPIECHFLSFV